MAIARCKQRTEGFVETGFRSLKGSNLGAGVPIMGQMVFHLEAG